MDESKRALGTYPLIRPLMMNDFYGRVLATHIDDLSDGKDSSEAWAFGILRISQNGMHRHRHKYQGKDGASATREV